ncbi:MAG: hypothetical protein JWQ13_3445, partial [Ramlibacter sp.]|nr:hypothetical protein [Ramlibacter sp.]
MKKFLASTLTVLLLAASGTVLAADEYNKVPAGDAQYRQCLSYAAKLYEGGGEKSP